MKERSILFSAPMVRAILAGEKTQTRRVVTLREFGRSDTQGYDFHFRDKHMRWHDYRADDFIARRCPYGVPGDRLWVRETWYDDNALRAMGPKPRRPDRFIEYRADHDCRNWEAGCPCNDDAGRSSWRPSIFMPRWASRLTLDVAIVRAQRLHDISEEDARAEGVTPIGPPLSDEQPIIGMPGRTNGSHPYTLAYACLWDGINGDREGCAWVDNPWVWAVSFNVAWTASAQP